MRSLLVLPVLSCLILTAGCSLGWRSTPLPDLPPLLPEKFLPVVRAEVQKAYDAAVASPRDAAAQGRLGMVFHAHEQVESALLCYRRARLLAGKEFRWVYLQAVAEMDLGKSQEAVATLRAALELDPSYTPAKLRLAEALLASGNTVESEQHYRTVVNEQPDSAAAHYGLGRAVAARGDAAAAAQSYERACELFPAYGAAHYALALAYRKLGREKEAEPHFAAYEKNKNDVPPSNDALQREMRLLAVNAGGMIREAVELEKQGQLEAAVVLHERALEVDPKSAQAHINLISLYGRLGNLEKAESHYHKAVGLNPNDAEAHYNYSVLMFGQRRFEECRQALERTLAVNAFHPEAHNNLAFLLEQQGRVNEAIAHYRTAIANKPDFRLAHFHLGRVLVTQKKYAEGIEHLKKTVTPEDADTPKYLLSLAIAYGRAGDRATGAVWARKALEMAIAMRQAPLAGEIDRELKKLTTE